MVPCPAVAAACPACAWGRRPDPALCAPAGLPDIVLSALVPEQIWALTPRAIAAVPAPKFAVSPWHPPLARSAGARAAPSPSGGCWASMVGAPRTRWRRDMSWLRWGVGAGPRRGWLPSPCRWCLAQLSCAPSPVPRRRLSPRGSAGGSAAPSARPWPVPSVRERLPRTAKVTAAGWLLSPHSAHAAGSSSARSPPVPTLLLRAQHGHPGAPGGLRSCGFGPVGRLVPLPARLMSHRTSAQMRPP